MTHQHVTVWWLLSAAALLSLERACYIWVCRAPDAFRRACDQDGLVGVGGPVEVLRRLFYAFKALQVMVFVLWCYAFGDGAFWPSQVTAATALGVLAMVVGQTLALSVFHRLGIVGVFYGTRFGHDVPWCRGFPFSMLRHPQYVGTLLSIWGFFLVMRFPHDDWFLLPALETIYYAVGARLESDAPLLSSTMARHGWARE